MSIHMSTHMSTRMSTHTPIHMHARVCVCVCVCVCACVGAWVRECAQDGRYFRGSMEDISEYRFRGRAPGDPPRRPHSNQHHWESRRRRPANTDYQNQHSLRRQTLLRRCGSDGGKWCQDTTWCQPLGAQTPLDINTTWCQIPNRANTA